MNNTRRYLYRGQREGEELDLHARMPSAWPRDGTLGEERRREKQGESVAERAGRMRCEGKLRAVKGRPPGAQPGRARESAPARVKLLPTFWCTSSADAIGAIGGGDGGQGGGTGGGTGGDDLREVGEVVGASPASGLASRGAEKIDGAPMERRQKWRRRVAVSSRRGNLQRCPGAQCVSLKTRDAFPSAHGFTQPRRSALLTLERKVVSDSARLRHRV